MSWYPRPGPRCCAEQAVRAEAGPHAGPDPTGGLPPHPAFGRASPSLLGGELLNLTYPPCLTPPQDRSRSRHRDRRRDCPQPSGTGGQLAQPGLTPVPGRFEDSVVVVTRSTRGADRSLDLDRSDPDYQFAHNFTKTLENHDLVRLKDSPAGTEMHPPIAALDLISQGITQRTSPGHSPTHPRTMNTYTP